MCGQTQCSECTVILSPSEAYKAYNLYCRYFLVPEVEEGDSDEGEGEEGEGVSDEDEEEGDEGEGEEGSGEADELEE